MASRVLTFLELVMVSWHWTCGCLTTLFPVVCASHCTIMSMFAPWKLTWISSGPAALLVFDWLSKLVPAAPFIQPGALAGGGQAVGQLAQVERQNEERVREARAAGLREGEAAAHNRAAAELKQTLDRVAQSRS